MRLTIYENLKLIITRIATTFNLSVSAAPTGRPRKIPIIDTLALALYQHKSTRATKKSIYEDFKKSLRCSYKTLVVSLNKSALLAKQIIEILMSLFTQEAHPIKYTDSTDLPVCLRKNADKHKTMQGLAGFGHSAKGWYYGLKMTMTRDFDGRMLGLRFTHPSANDRDIFRNINKNLMGILVADAGYVSKKLEQDMYIEHRRMALIRPYKSMKRLAALWQLAVYKGRFKIEFDFRCLKLFYGLVTSMPPISEWVFGKLPTLTAFVCDCVDCWSYATCDNLLFFENPDIDRAILDCMKKSQF